LVNDFEVKGNFTFAKFQLLNEKGRFLIILDGFDEMADRVLDGLPQEHFEELGTLACKNGKVILSSRTHYFKDPDHVFEVHEDSKAVHNSIEGRSQFEILFLNAFTEEDIDKYLQDSFKDEWENYKNIIKSTYDLKSLAEVPILLNMIVQILPDMVRENKMINRSEIYQTFTDKWFKREQWRRGLHTKERIYFCMQLAMHFYKRQENYVHWKTLPQYIKDYFKDKVDTHTDLDVFEADVRTSNFLIRKEDSGNYFFVHKSFMEFFVAKWFLDNIRNNVVDGLDDLKDFIKSKVIYEFLVEMINKEDIEIVKKDVFKKDKVNFNELISNKQRNLERIYNTHISIGNCAYLLIQNGVLLDNALLDTAKLSGLVIMNASFKKTSLSGSDFSHCSLTNIDFTSANLNYANFEGATLKDVCFKGTSLEKANFVNANIDNKTLEGIGKSKYWGSIKISDNYRLKVKRSYEKAEKIN
jgi:predicted NACHT family NTPase